MITDSYPVNFRIEFKCYLLDINNGENILICNEKISKRIIKRYVRYGLLDNNGNPNTRQRTYINNIKYEKNEMQNSFYINFVVKDWRDSDNGIIENCVMLQNYIMENIWPAEDYLDSIILMVKNIEYKIKYVIKSIEFTKL